MNAQMNSPLNEIHSDSDLIIRLHFCNEQERNEILIILYERYKKVVLKVCCHYLSDYEEAQDVFHNVFIKVIENAERLNNPAVFKSWLLTIARNQCIDRMRSTSFKNVQKRDSKEIEALADDKTEERYIAKMQSDRILKYLSSGIQELDSSLRAVLKLRSHGLKAHQISKMLGMTRNELRRTYRKLKLNLECHMQTRGIKLTIRKIIRLAENYGIF